MRNRRKKEISFIFTNGMAHDFYGHLHDACCAALHERFENKFRIHFDTVVSGKDPLSEAMAINFVESQEYDRLIALVIVPLPTSTFSASVAQSILKRKVPVIALARGFEATKEFTSRGVNVPTTVMSNNYFGGYDLGQFSGHDRSGSVNVTLIPGQYHRSDSQQRLAGFEDGLKDTGLIPVVTTLSECLWSRDLTKQCVKNFLLASETPQVDLMFAGNDEMILGARDAIVELGMQIDHKVDGSSLFGYDGNSEVCDLLREHDKYLKGTVEQDHESLAIELAHVLEQYLQIDEANRHNSVVSSKPIPPKRRVRSDPEPIPTIPPFDRESGDWMTAKEAAERLIETTDAMRKWRERKPKYTSPDNLSGIDSKRLVWRRRPGGTRTSNVYYHIFFVEKLLREQHGRRNG